MAREWQEVNPENNEIWDREKPIQGTYIGMKEDVGQNNSRMYTIKTKKGNVGIWGSTVLNARMDDVPVNWEVKIECLGKTTGKKGSEYLDFKVLKRPPEFEEVKESPAKKNSESEEEVNLEDIPF